MCEIMSHMTNTVKTEGAALSCSAEDAFKEGSANGEIPPIHSKVQKVGRSGL